MKFFALIMAITILAVSSLPCMDGLLTDKAKTELNTSQSQEHNNSDDCSPFCTCSCCSASAFYYPAFKMQAGKLIFKNEKYPLLDIVFHTEGSSSIWQPPKVS